jgi:hypothetical protein
MKLAKGAEGGFIMRSGSKRLMIGMGTFLIAAALTAPSFAGKKAVSDEELDMVTAAGQPVLISIGGSGTVTFNGTSSMTQLIEPSSQTNLRALILNNVVGENQVHNAINVSTLNPGGGQTNNITQSWGSILDLTAVTTANAITSVPAVSCGSALICKTSGTFVTTAGSIRILSKAADQIIHISGSGTVTYNPSTNIATDISDLSQNSLVALVVNNVVGINQVATGINIIGNTLTVDNPLTVGAGSGVFAGQNNTIQQYRGTPINFR